MGILNASPDSFSDPGSYPSLNAQMERAHEMAGQGAAIIDVGGESAVTNRPALGAGEEIERVGPLVERLVQELDIPVSVDTYKAEVAREAVRLGASMVNDVSGLTQAALAQVCASSGAALVVMHTRVEPKRKLNNPQYDDVVDDVCNFLAARIEFAEGHGVAPEQIVVDPGIDFAKSPSQSVEALRNIERLHDLGRPVMVALSRKDFIGALTLKPPRQRLGGTLAALGFALDRGAAIVRAHDVAETCDFIRVHSALAGQGTVAQDLTLPDDLRWERAPASVTLNTDG